MMKFPYGMSDFEKIILNGYFYVDRTDKIPLIEDIGEYPLFLRPRRFGKSLWLSTLENYYDVAKTEQFDQLFGHLAIGKNPTPRHNQYFVMNWDFSAVDSTGEAHDIRQRLHNHINGSIKRFIAHYDGFLKTHIEIEPTDAVYSLQSLLAALEQTPYKLYLLIDEYDNFANEVMMASLSKNRERYETLIQGEGALKAIFKAVKAGTKGQGIDRIFITGVSPVVMSDISSGFNIAENIYLEPEFNNLCGFQESEIAETLFQIANSCDLPTEKAVEALNFIRALYNGYGFSYDANELIYNPTLALYFMKAFLRTCRYPSKVLDSNLAMDRGKIRYISQLPNGRQLIMDALDDSHPVAISELSDRFGIEEVLTATKDMSFMASLLYYFGVLTLTNKHTTMGKRILKIPNFVVRKLYIERIQEMLLPEFTSKDKAQQVVELFYQTGNLKPLCDFMEQTYFKVFDNRDYRWTNELTIKTAFLSLLFNDIFYLMDSETPLNRSYADLTMIVRPDMRQYQLLDFLLEFKYVSLKKAGFTASQIAQKSVEELKALAPVMECLAQSKTQLKSYRETLLSNSGNTLRLHTYSVVAIGYERVLWIEHDF
jgi:hypothetical protein